MAIFKGAGVALVTPFHEDESINYKALERLIEGQMEGHTDAIILARLLRSDSYGPLENLLR